MGDTQGGHAGSARAARAHPGQHGCAPPCHQLLLWNLTWQRKHHAVEDGPAAHARHCQGSK